MLACTTQATSKRVPGVYGGHRLLSQCALSNALGRQALSLAAI